MKTIFKKEYDGESISDIERDVLESFDERFNPEASIITLDDNFIPEGKFIVTVQWTPHEDY